VAIVTQARLRIQHEQGLQQAIDHEHADHGEGQGDLQQRTEKQTDYRPYPA
jgi:hypothetical protein